MGNFDCARYFPQLLTTRLSKRCLICWDVIYNNGGHLKGHNRPPLLMGSKTA